jgi:hypothetical protein
MIARAGALGQVRAGEDCAVVLGRGRQPGLSLTRLSVGLSDGVRIMGASRVGTEEMLRATELPSQRVPARLAVPSSGLEVARVRFLMQGRW